MSSALQTDSEVTSAADMDNLNAHASAESRITQRNGQIIIVHKRSGGGFGSKEYLENMLIDEEHKHARKMSYRWLVFNAIFQAACLLLICLTIFLFPLIDYTNDQEQDVTMGVLDLIVDDSHYEIFQFRPKSSICEQQMA